MNTSRSTNWHRIISTTAVAGMILGIASLVIGIAAMLIAGPTSSDDSPSVVATLLLMVVGLVVAVVSALLRVGEALRGWVHRHHVSGTPS
jgi:hypothetical protein